MTKNRRGGKIRGDEEDVIRTTWGKKSRSRCLIECIFPRHARIPGGLFHTDLSTLTTVTGEDF